MSLEIDRAKPTVQVCTLAILMSGVKALRLSARFAPTAMGYVGSGLNGAGVRRLVCESRTGHDSPAGTSPLLASRRSVIEAPRLSP